MIIYKEGSKLKPDVVLGYFVFLDVLGIKRK